MARNNNRFHERFQHAGLFLVIAIVLAIPLTVWSLNNVSTQIQQNAAITNPTTRIIYCGPPNYLCSGGFTCGHCTGANPINGPTSNPRTMCTCIPKANPTPTPQLIACGSPNYLCPGGFTCGHCTGAIPNGTTPKPSNNTGCVCIPKANPTPTQTVCITDSDCQNGAKCMTVGPIMANQPVHKVCVPPGIAVPQ